MGPIDVRDLLRLQSVPGLGPRKIHSLISHFGTPGAILAAPPRDLARVSGISKKLALVIRRHVVPDDLITEQLKAMEMAGAAIVTYWDDRYPTLLKNIYDPPLFLFVHGELLSSDEALIAVVGTRTPSPYGERAVSYFVPGLVEAGYSIVSGLARGIDTLAHREALRHHGRTIGVLGSGIDVPYPRENAGLMREIARSGAVITEFAMGTTPEAPNFPRRNRIVSGMTRGTLVVESAQDGGAMITASSALDQNREVFAVPGPVFNPGCRGPHTLIHEGRAKLVQSVEDILDELPTSGHAASISSVHKPVYDLTLFEQRILDLLADEPLHVDQIAHQASIGVPDALVALLGLEFKKLARQLPGRFFVALT